MHDYFPERRTSRSDSVHEALLLQLKASARRAGFSSLVLADDQGLVIACAGNQTIGEYLAALSPGLTPEFKTWHGKVLTNRGRVRLSIAPIKFEDSHIYIAATEGASSQIHKELFTSGLGAVRILMN
ncbi:MAG: hypothetical protein GY854_06755 [Deltaproteobacteria bacterium]|nr:hypothetical protein [Deltaproteobacteria bacterium]